MHPKDNYRYSILTTTPIEAMPLKADTVGLKADWPQIPWGKIGLPASAMAKLATEIAGLPQTAYVIEPYENICGDSVEFGYELLLQSARPIYPERIARIQMACTSLCQSIMQRDVCHTPQFQLDPKFDNLDSQLIDDACTNFLQEHGNCKIPVPFRCEIGDNSIICAGQFAKKPPTPARKSENSIIHAKFEGTQRNEITGNGSAPEFKTASCHVVEFASNYRRTLTINDKAILLVAHRNCYLRSFFVLTIREDYGADDKVTFRLVKIGEPSEHNQPRLNIDS